MEEDGQAPVFDDEIVPFHVESHPRHHNPPPVEEIVWPDGPEYTAVAPMDPAHRGLRVSVEILTEVLEDGEAREGEIDDRATKTMDMALEVDLPGHRTAHITLRMPHNLEAVWSQEGWLFGRFSFRPYHHGYQDELQGPVCLMTYPLVKINRLPGIAHGLAALYNPPQPVHPASPVAQRGRGQAGQRGGRAVRRGRGGASAAPPPQAQDQDRPVADGPAPRRSRRLRRPVERLGFDERDETPPPAARRARGQTRAAGAASSRANARRRGGPGTSPRNGSRRGARGGIVPLP
jgi:hypothetical protein